MPEPLRPIEQVCPKCQGTDLVKSKTVLQSEEYEGILRKIECENCGATWDAIYRVGGYTNLAP